MKVITSRCLCEDKYKNTSHYFYDNCELVTTLFDRFKFGLTIPRKWFNYIGRIVLGFHYTRHSRDCNIIHYQQSSDYSFGWFPLIALLLLPSKSKKIVTIHSFDSYTRKFRIFNKIYRYADAIIVHSNLVKEQMIQEGIPEAKLHVIFFGGKIVPELNRTRTRITFFGAPEKAKGFFTIIEALRILSDEGIGVHLDVYGIYTKESERVARMEAEKLTVAGLITWHGRISENEFDEKMQESMFTFAVYQDPVWGSSIIIRAMMNGTPVIATPIGGSPEYLGDAGIYVHPNDPQALSSTVRKLIEDGELRQEKERMSRERAIRYLSEDAIADQTVQLYRSVLNT